MKKQPYQAPTPGVLSYVDPDGIERWLPEDGSAPSNNDKPVSRENGFRTGYTGPPPDWKALERSRQQSLNMTGVIEREKGTGANLLRNVHITSRAASLEDARLRTRPEPIRTEAPRTVWR